MMPRGGRGGGGIAPSPAHRSGGLSTACSGAPGFLAGSPAHLRRSSE